MSLVRELCRGCRWVKGIWAGPSPMMLNGDGFIFVSGCSANPRRDEVSVWCRRVWRVLVIMG